MSDEQTTEEKTVLLDFDNLVDLAMSKKPGEFQQSFVDLMRDRIGGKVAAIKQDMRQYLFAKEPREVGDNEVEVVDNSIPEVEEEALGKEEMPDSGSVEDKICAATHDNKESGSKPSSRWWTARQAQLAKELQQTDTGK